MRDTVWLSRFLQSFRDVRDRIAAGEAWESLIARCTADELVVHIITNHVKALMADRCLADPEDAGLRLPRFEEDDDPSWVGRQRELLLEDFDVLELFDHGLDGIDDANSEISVRFGFANLRTDRWFLPFRPSEQ